MKAETCLRIVEALLAVASILGWVFIYYMVY